MPFLLSLTLVALFDAVFISGIVYTARSSPPSKEELEFAYLRDRHPPLKKE